MQAIPTPQAARLPASRRWRERMRETTRNMLRGLVSGDSAIVMALDDAPMNAAHFEQAVCRNCGTLRSEPHCGACGQGAVRRYSLKDVWSDVRGNWDLFELAYFHSAWRLLRKPGLVAREYLLGARSRHTHPLTLLLFAVGVLMLVLNKTGYLTAGQTELSAQMKMVATWSNGSFSLGLVALFVASLLIFPRRLRYNPTEHLVLAIYLQFVVIALNVLNLLPLLLLDSTQWAVPWRSASAWYMTPIELAIIGWGWKQFFCLDWRRHAWRIALALLVFWLVKKALLLGYARIIMWMVLAG